MALCDATVYRGTFSKPGRCRRKGPNKSANGLNYCKQHLPENAKAKEERRAEERAENFRENIPQIHGKAMLAVLREIAAGAHDPWKVAKDYLERYDSVR